MKGQLQTRRKFKNGRLERPGITHNGPTYSTFGNLDLTLLVDPTP